jgi:hypothetical protein
MCLKGSKVDNSGINLQFRYLLKEKKKTVSELATVLERSRDVTYKYLRDPTRLTIKQLYTLSGYFDTPVIDLFVRLHLNTPTIDQPTKEVKLTDLVKSIK